MMALPNREMCFWPAKTRTKLDFFEMHTSLEPGAKKLLWHKTGKWIQLPFISSVLVKKVASFVGMSFSNSLSGFRLKFFRIALLRKRLQFDSKSDMTTNGLILEFFVRIWLFCWLHICNDWNVHELFKCAFLLTTSNPFDD